MKIWTDELYPIIISCAKELTPWTEREVKELGYKTLEVTKNTVVVSGNIRDVFLLNLKLRTAHRVLVPLLRARCNNIRDLYKHVYSIDWENLLDVDGYFSVSSIVHNKTVRDTRLPSLITKDGIVDRMRDKLSRRPNSGPDSSGAAVFVHWEYDPRLRYDKVIIYLDTSGVPLSKRGYRMIPGSAPMQETLAAACIKALNWDCKTPFVSPMCGSGTPAIEAALLALNRAPGSIRSHFAFMALKGWKQIIPGTSAPRVAPRQRFGVTPEMMFKEMLLELKDQENSFVPPIIATDISPDAVQNALVNAQTAGVAQYITFKACDFGDTQVPETSGNAEGVKGCVFFNPEYGIRLGDPEELKPIYARIGTFMAEKCAGYTGAVLTGNPDLAACVKLAEKTRVPFYNGPIDCRLLVYDGCRLLPQTEEPSEI